MLAHRLEVDDQDLFDPMTELFNSLQNNLKAQESNAMTASDLERFIQEQSQNIAREAYQAKLNMIGRLESATVI